MNCTWQTWSDWTPCDVTCGEGEQIRERESTEALFGGLACQGDRVDMRVCRTRTNCQSKIFQTQLINVNTLGQRETDYNNTMMLTKELAARYIRYEKKFWVLSNRMNLIPLAVISYYL